ncbi:MAG TPA: hypothetical protein ENK30_03210 [Anaerolineae bacterium]|nr:hypothetical protein [Anaerolineae bacterium]
MFNDPERLRKLAIALFIPIPLLTLALVLAIFWRTNALYYVTGEEDFAAQLKGLSDLAADRMRPRVHTAPEIPAAHSGVNPFGVNVFLEQEPDPAVRERAVRMARAAGFHWLRQEFPWEDIEIHGKGDFQDRRHEPYRSAWEKYDHIVDLAEKYDMELIVRVSNPPAWSRAQGNEVGSYAPPDNYQDFADFVYALVSRYKGRVRYYQLWNEPNIYPEWGNYAISPEDYARLLCLAADAARRADPNVVIINGAMASTIVLDPAAEPPGNALNDFLFMQRLYDAGAAGCFDIVAMQGYGLWSGPTDRRMNPRVLNFSRPLFMRDLMVANGDAHKPIWISEMNWNAVPDEVPDKRFGQVTPEQQARYLVEAYERIQKEWPWLGVANVWYLKRPTDQWKQEGKPEYYFRLLEPDFTTTPAYEALKAYAPAQAQAPIMHPGAHPPDHWAIESEEYRVEPARNGPLHQVGVLPAGGTLHLRVDGSRLLIHAAPDAMQARFSVAVGERAPRGVGIDAGEVVAIRLRGASDVTIRAEDDLRVDYWEVKGGGNALLWLAPLFCLTLVFLLAAIWLAFRWSEG